MDATGWTSYWRGGDLPVYVPPGDTYQLCPHRLESKETEEPVVYCLQATEDLPDLCRTRHASFLCKERCVSLQPRLPRWSNDLGPTARSRRELEQYYERDAAAPFVRSRVAR